MSNTPVSLKLALRVEGFSAHSAPVLLVSGAFMLIQLPLAIELCTTFLAHVLMAHEIYSFLISAIQHHDSNNEEPKGMLPGRGVRNET
jgi:hypothetical protein